MKISQVCSGIVSAALLTVISIPASAQRVPANYTTITYRKVAPEKVDAYLAFAKSHMKKVIETRVAGGGIQGWSLLKLTAPYSIGGDYNYAQVIYSSTYPDLDPAAAEVAATYQKAGVNRAEYQKLNAEFGAPVSQQITRTMMRVGPVADVGDFVRVDYHSTPAERPGELVELEETVYAPMFKAIIEAGKGPRGWTLAAPVLPLATELGYSFFTTQVYKDSASMGRGLGLNQELFMKTHPGRSYLNTMQHVRELDKIVKVRIYRVLDKVGAPVVPR